MPPAVFCTQCGREIPEDAEFCPRCGARQVIPGVPERPVTPPPPPLSPLPPPPAVPGQWRSVRWAVLGILVVGGILAIGFFSGLLTPILPGFPRENYVDIHDEGFVDIVLPGPTQAVPPGKEVYVQVQKNPINGNITFTFAGGPGQKVVKSIDVEVYPVGKRASWGRLQPVVNDEVTLPGTRDRMDRVVVTVTYLSGESYTIIDQVMEPRK